jgi:hypothetical protein
LTGERFGNRHAEVFKTAGRSKFILAVNKQARLTFAFQHGAVYFDVRQRLAETFHNRPRIFIARAKQLERYQTIILPGNALRNRFNFRTCKTRRPAIALGQAMDNGEL